MTRTRSTVTVSDGWSCDTGEAVQCSCDHYFSGCHFLSLSLVPRLGSSLLLDLPALGWRRWKEGGWWRCRRVLLGEG